MAHVLLLGHSKREQEIHSSLTANFHVLTPFHAVTEGLNAINFLRPEVILLPENMTSSARANLVEKVQKISPDTRVVFLYEHFIDSAQFADAIVDTKADPEYLIAAIEYVCLHQGSIWKSATAAA
jgi:DNA-binding NarL/FixJ family response regulator